jgi:hypothetical protein
MPKRANTFQTIAVVVSAAGLLSACGIGPVHNPPPALPPAPPMISEPPANLRFQPPWLTFGGTPLGERSPAQSTVLTNLGDETLTFTRMVAIVDKRDFDIDSTCGHTLAAGASCTITVVYHPTVIGPATGRLTYFIAGHAPASVTLRGEGIRATAP